MKYLEKSSEDEMISIFLISEIGSTRFRGNLLKILDKHQIPELIITKPDINNKEENVLRKKILSDHRGYGNNTDLFENFPTKVSWEKITLNIDDLYSIKLVNGPYWNNLSDHTRLAKVAVKKIKENKTNERIFNAAEALSNGKIFPPIILVSNHKNGEIVVLEGHLRLLAYLIEPKNTPQEINALIGYSPDFIKWNLF